MANVKVLIHQKFTDKDTGVKYLTGEHEIPEGVAKRAALLGWLGIYKKAKKKK